MDTLENNIKKICNNYYRYFLSLQNVNGIGYGFKYINNLNTFKPCVNVFVEKKISKNYITYNNLVPKEYMGIMTDVIEVGELKIKKGEAIPNKIRPLQGGCSISSYEDGTLGCIVKRPYYYFFNEYFILSNNHVLVGLNNDAPIGFPVLQPAFSISGRDSNNIVANLTDYIPLQFITNKNNDYYPVNYVDCAIAKVSRNFVSNEIYSLGKIKGIGKIFIGEEVRKVGYNSGLTEGVITKMHATVELGVDNTRSLLFKDLIVSSLKHKPGDSGSIVVNKSNEVLGLFIGGGDEGISFMCDITLVLSLLNVALYI